MSIEPLMALHQERAALLDFCHTLTAEEWTRVGPSGQSVQDVVAELVASLRALLTPQQITVTTSSLLHDRDAHSKPAENPHETLQEFKLLSLSAIAGMALYVGPRAEQIVVSVNGLGRYPATALPSMYLFDWHTRLYHDIAPAVGRPVPGGEFYMDVILDWLMAVLAQSPAACLAHEPISITLAGEGAGRWLLEPGADGQPTVTRNRVGHAATRIFGDSDDFLRWSTGRADWRQCDIGIDGNHELAVRVLDLIQLG
ncbi:hypothetical protein GPX89_26080 [Nocardia sp. ET3-3]|uniref:Uncharacterized protein n=1 Tax=Nocardia terrae TaxID=2675851 RepID=A0A7K1V3I7_9NOCA|nr:hypothetical protein [Nocardia terrae]MVU80708.1 hypothetical protein [Nocardia terrae]